MPRWTEDQLREAIVAADSISDVLRHFGLRVAGDNHRTVTRWVEEWGISTEHFTHGKGRPVGRRYEALPLEEVLVERSAYSRAKLKQRLYETGLRARECELCGQGEQWRGAPMSLILDHVNGVHDDNRLENLRIVCPNCNATLPTHCGRNNVTTGEPRPCKLCGTEFKPNYGAQLYCSRRCGQRNDRVGRPNPGARRVERPPYEQLMEEIATSSWSAVGRRYGVSCNAVRKWVQLEQTLRAEAREGTSRDSP